MARYRALVGIDFPDARVEAGEVFDRAEVPDWLLEQNLVEKVAAKEARKDEEKK